MLPHLDLTHVIDCTGAYIPGHGTGTVILLGRHRLPVSNKVRTVLVVRGETVAPENPASAPVWLAIVAQVDLLGSESDHVSVADIPRSVFHRHPWSVGGTAVSQVKKCIEQQTGVLRSLCATAVGGAVRTGSDELFSFCSVRRRHSLIPASSFRPFLSGDRVRDWRAEPEDDVYYPYSAASRALAERDLWRWRTTLAMRRTFQGVMADSGLSWTDYMQYTESTYRSPFSIVFAFISTHNHFVLDRGGNIFNRPAPVIKLRPEASEDDHLGLLGLLNSSTACFWLKQVCYPKGGDGIGRGIATEKWEVRLAYNGTNVEDLPIPLNMPLDLAKTIDALARELNAYMPGTVLAEGTPTREKLDAARDQASAIRARMIALQEELDWRCYKLFSLLDDAPEHANPPPLRLGERAFEIVMARRIEAGELASAWFERHRSTPLIETPTDWPADYRTVVERRIALIETDPNIGLIENPDHKRRWSVVPWEEMERMALRDWLLDRLEDQRYWPARAPRLVSTNHLADAARQDAEFLSVAALYAKREDFDVEALLAELVTKESVPFLATLRYSETGMRKRLQWEETWQRQRHEDAIDADVVTRKQEFLARAGARAQEEWRNINLRREGEEIEAYVARMSVGVDAISVAKQAEKLIAEEQRRRKQEEVGTIPVPAKYTVKDFRSQDHWRLRGGLDVPKERFVSFPYCSPEADGSLLVTWAGHNHLARAMAIGTFYQARKDEDGWQAERLAPLLAGLQELLPWLLQWHNGADEGRMGDYFGEFIRDEARAIGLTEEAVTVWAPPARAGRVRRRVSA